MIALSLCWLVSQAYSRLPGKWEGKESWRRPHYTVDSVPVAFTSFPLLEEGPHEGVHNIRLVLLQPVASPGDDVEAEVVPDVQATCLRHFLLQKSIPLTPQQ